MLFCSAVVFTFLDIFDFIVLEQISALHVNVAILLDSAVTILFPVTVSATLTCHLGQAFSFLPGLWACWAREKADSSSYPHMTSRDSV